MTVLDFRLDIVKNLLGPDREHQHEEEEDNEGEVKHLPTKLPLNDKGIRARKKCKVCTRNGRRKDTTYQCKACPETPALCLQDCFASYHA
ncbi:hypothetical protein J6590_017100 [Homalodisca vitripennis]|nr:hypothetical protein J6590_017100 [Homalodisca vitripennis]